jgi:hypothetical protein
MLSKHMLIGPIILLAFVLFGYPVYWLYAASIGEELLHGWIDEQRQDGFTVNHGPIETTGFPFLVRIEISAPDASNPATGLSWRSAKLHLELQPWDLKRYRLEALGTQRMRYSGKAGEGDFTVNTTGIEGVAVISDSGTLAGLSLVLKNVQITEADRGSLLKTNRILVDTVRPDHPPIAHTESAFEISVAAEQIILAALYAPILGDTITSIQAKAEFLGPLNGDTVFNALSEWRHSGGTLEVHWLNMIWGALDLRANGTMALDTQMRPLGALTADMRGYEETLNALAEANLLRRDILPASRVILNLLAKTSPSDGRRVLTVPITAREGALFLGPIKLADLPPLLTPSPTRPSARQD